MLLNPRFIQQWNVEAKPVFAGFCGGGERNPAFMNPRMQNCLKCFTSLIIVKNKFPQRSAIWLSIFMENIRPKPRPHCILNRPVARE